jgi:hypothetical protein
MLDRKTAALACALVSLAGSMAAADVTVDGKATAGDNYGAAKWVQTVPVSPTASFGDNLAGMGDVGAGSVGDPSAPTTGLELAIPYSALGVAGALPAVKMQVMITNNFGDNTSNQTLPGLALNTGNLGYTRTVNFNSIAGLQFYDTAGASPNPTISIGAVTTAQTIDGNRATAGDSYGAVSGTRLQTNSTGYGDAGHGQLVFAGGFGPEGSELDAISVRKNDTTHMLYVMVTGNLEASGNRITIFFDTVAGGQNTILATTGAPLEGMGGFGADPGLTFDTGFDADYMVSVNASRTTQPEGTPPANDQYLLYVDYAQLVSGVGATKVYAGSTVFPGVAGFNGGALSGGDVGAPAILAAMSNVNTVGVVGGQVGGDFRAPNVDYAYGSEIDGVFSKVENDKLYVLVTGNFNATFAKLNLFFDCQDGGQNRLRGGTQAGQSYVGNPDIDYNGLNRMGADTLGTDEFGNPAPANGVKFDAGFAADYWMVCTTGPRTVAVPNLGGNPFVQEYANAAVLRTAGMRQDFLGRAQDYGAYDGGRKHPDNFPMDFDGPQFDVYASNANIYCNYAPRTCASQAANGAQPVPFLIRMAIDNSNVGGVTVADVAGAGAVTTGAEIEIALSELIDGWTHGSPVPVIRVAGFISNEGPTLGGDRYAYVANQVIGGLPLNGGQAADLGDPRTVDFSTLAGDQFVVLTPTGPAQCGPADIGSTGGIAGPDGVLNNNDFVIFIDFFFAQNPLADQGSTGGIHGPDGAFNNNDFVVFIDNFFTGC